MKLNKTVLFVGITTLIVLGIYIFDYKAEADKEEAKQPLILNYSPEQINYIQITKPDIKISLQKTQTGWVIQEPFRDLADSKNIHESMSALATERQVSVVANKETELSESELKEFGLDKPSIVFNFKNESGNTQKISVGSIKNFEGNSYLRIDSENKVLMGSPIWSLKAELEIIYYREKRLYREDISKISKIHIKSLRDEFELILVNGLWQEVNTPIALDQIKVREMIKKISEVNISQYIFEGEPSSSFIKEKGLDLSPIKIEIQTENSSWSSELNYNSQDKILYALTERPTYLVKAEVSSWESLGNLNLDELRDRTSVLSFNLDEVHHIYYKGKDSEVTIATDKTNNKDWHGVLIVDAASKTLEKVSSEAINKILYKIHDLKISEFLDRINVKNNFDGKNMLILKSSNNKLVLQLNWGPSFKIVKSGADKEYYFVRTHLSDFVFAIEKSLIDSLGFDKILIPTSKDMTTLTNKSEEKIEK